MADFMGYFQTNAACEVGRLRKWRAKVWSRRYEAMVRDLTAALYNVGEG